MPTIEEIRSVLAEINDPEIHRSIVELTWSAASTCRVPAFTVDLALTIPGCPSQVVLPGGPAGQAEDRFPRSPRCRSTSAR